jgi:ATP-binding cassette subfamily B protein
VKHADQIIVLEEGKIIEKGTHEQLITLNATYAEMYNQQLLEDQKKSVA